MEISSLPNYCQVVSKDEIDPELYERYQKHSESKTTEYLTSRQAIKNLLENLKIKSDSLNFDIIKHHHLEKYPNLLVSLSHTKNLGAAIVMESNSEILSVGIDIEWQTRTISPKIEKYFLNQLDILDSDTPILKLWTKKEAVFKALSSYDEKNISYQDIICSDDKFIYKQHATGAINSLVSNNLIISIAILQQYNSI